MNLYNNIQLDKGMYNTEKSFSKTLEALDPSENYKSTALEGLDAFERQLKRFDIKVKGYNSDTVSKFFQSSASATLFPEYVKRCVMAGINENSILDKICATNTKISALDYRPMTSTATGATAGFDAVAIGSEIPSTEIKMQDVLVSLKKSGRMLVSSYEAIKFQRLDLFAVTLKQIGAFIAKSQLKSAVEVLINGDGNNNPATVINVATAGTLTYPDLMTLWGKFDDFSLKTILVAPDVMLKMLNIAEFKDPTTGLNFQATGTLSTPMGATLYSTNAVPAGKIIGIDTTCALEMVTAADISIESDKLIDKQMERAAITSINGFAKIFKDAAVVMKV